MSRASCMPVATAEEGLQALATMLGWNGGVLPFWSDDGTSRPSRRYLPCADDLYRRLDAARMLHDGRHSREVTLGLPEVRESSFPFSTVLWCWVQGKDQVWRAATQFQPAPSMVLRIDGSTRRLLLWWLKEPLDYPAIEPANRKIAYALHATQKLGCPRELRIPLPGAFVRVGRSRPAAVIVTRLDGRAFTRREIVSDLKDPPSKDAWREKRR